MSSTAGYVPCAIEGTAELMDVQVRPASTVTDAL